MKDKGAIQERLHQLERRLNDDQDTAITHMRYGQLQALAWVLEDDDVV